MCSCRFCVHICKGFTSLRIIHTTFSLDFFWLLISPPASLIIPMYKQRGCHGTPWAVFVTSWKFLHFFVSASIYLTLTQHLSFSTKKKSDDNVWTCDCCLPCFCDLISIFYASLVTLSRETRSFSLFFYCKSFFKTYLFFKTSFYFLNFSLF